MPPTRATVPTTAARSTLTLIPSAPATPVPTAGPSSVVVQLTPGPRDPAATSPDSTGTTRRPARSTTVTSPPASASSPGPAPFAPQATLSTVLVPPGAPLSAAGSASQSSTTPAATPAGAAPAGPEAVARGGDPLALDLPAGCPDVTRVVATPTDTADGGGPVRLTRLTSADPAIVVVDTTKLAVGTHLLQLDCGTGSPARATVSIFRQNGAARGEANSIVLAGGMGLASMAALVGRPGPFNRRRVRRAAGEAS